MAIDPICGMTVDEATARRVERDGKTVYFCSEHCRQKFLAGTGKTWPEPSAYAPARHEAAPEAQQAAGKYICPMHPEVAERQAGKLPEVRHGAGTGPSRGPKAEDHLHLPDAPADRAGPAGQCPICGMALEPKTIQPDTEEDDSELRDMTRRFWVSARLDRAGSAAGDVAHDRRRRWTIGWELRCSPGCNSCSARRWSCGAAGRSSSVAGGPSSPGT